MFKQLSFYALPPTMPPALSLALALAPAAFAPTLPSQPESRGWAPASDDGLVTTAGGYWLLRFEFEKRVVPPSTLAAAVDRKADGIEQETGRRPKGKRLKELREETLLELLPRAFTRRTHVDVLVDAAAGFVGIGSTTASTVDVILGALSHALSGICFPLQTARPASVCMGAWLDQQQGPAGFSLDRECELKQPDGEKARVRYSHHSLEIDEIREHMRQGKVPTQVALTFAGRVSFVLLDRPTLTIKSVKLLDVCFEGRNAEGDALKADLLLAGAELSTLRDELAAEMGGVVNV